MQLHVTGHTALFIECEAPVRRMQGQTDVTAEMSHKGENPFKLDTLSFKTKGRGSFCCRNANNNVLYFTLVLVVLICNVILTE